MAILKKRQMKAVRRSIDLTGPDGNAYVLLGYAKQWCKDLDKDWEDVRKRMTSGDYENLVKVFDEEFGSFCDLYR